MAMELTAIVENGMLKPDEAVPFPDRTRVKLTIEPIWDAAEASAAWKRLLAMIEEKPLFQAGERFSRDELYERD
jgi:predicted DNA-binding antitoxin AbrB/MazE fold protein